jgi:hypothetical protein
MSPTIVGGRPDPNDPTGPEGPLEFALEKAVKDAVFRERFLTDPMKAVEEHGVYLPPAGTSMLAAMPKDQLRQLVETLVAQNEARIERDKNVTPPEFVLGIRPDRVKFNPSRPLDPAEGFWRRLYRLFFVKRLGGR